MSGSFWAAAGPSRPTVASFAAVPPPATVAKKKRGRFSDGNKSKHADAIISSSIPSIVNPPSPELVPRHSSSASSWGIEDLSDSDGDYEYWPTPSASLTTPPIAATGIASNTSPDLDRDRDELAKFARPAKRLHVETPEDRHTYGKMAGLQIDPTSLASSAPQHYASGRPQGMRSNSGVAGTFGLSSSLASAFAANIDVGLTPAPRVPPSSPTKTDAISTPFQSSASTIYQQAVAPAPPTSPSLASRGVAPPSSPLHTQGFFTSTSSTISPTKSSISADLQDSDMRLRRGVPSSYEVEPDRIVVTSLDDTSSSEAGDDSNSPTGGHKTPDADTSTESASDFVINNELIEKLEAHSRAVLTGTSDRDNSAAASTSRSGTGSSTSNSNRSSRRSGGRRSVGGSAVSNLGSLLSSRRRSAQSSPASSGYASPINAEDARGALILWNDPNEVLKSTTATTSASPLKHQSDLASVPESGIAAMKSFMDQAPVSFQSGSGIPGMATLQTTTTTTSPSHSLESPLYAQQSSLSSSYFPQQPSALEAHFGHTQPGSQPFGTASPHSFDGNSAFGRTSHYHHHQQQQQSHTHPPITPPITQPAFGQPEQQQHQYNPHHPSHPHIASSQHANNNLGAQPIDLSGSFGVFGSAAEEMDLDS